MKLTEQQIEFFNREGWLFLPELFTPEEVAFLAREAERIYEANRPEVWREKSGAPRTAFAAHLYNEAFGVLGAHPRMIDPIEQIFAYEYAVAGSWSDPTVERTARTAATAARPKPVLRFGESRNDHPLGRLLIFDGGKFASSYRIKDKQITSVNRHVGKENLTITTLENDRNKEGLFLQPTNEDPCHPMTKMIQGSRTKWAARSHGTFDLSNNIDNLSHQQRILHHIR